MLKLFPAAALSALFSIASAPAQSAPPAPASSAQTQTQASPARTSPPQSSGQNPVPAPSIPHERPPEFPPAPPPPTLRLPHILSDHAVLQRDQPIHIWGWAAPDQSVAVAFHGQTRTTTANDLGQWTLWLAPESAGGPYILTVTTSPDASSPDTATAPITLSDILVGDVWFASGQSNMEIPLNGFPHSAVIKNAAQEIAAANLPTVHLLHIADKASFYPLDDTPATWTTCTPDTAQSFSAVAYFFGRQINAREHVPVGLIDSSWGGTPVEPWISMDTIGSDAGLMPIFATWAHFTDGLASRSLELAREHRAMAAAIAAHQPLPSFPWHPDGASWQPAALYNGMIAPAVPYTMKGVLWYQGETNSDPARAAMYHRFFAAMISDWRQQWNIGNFPFFYVQISNFGSPAEDWGVIRDAQRRTLSLANTAMAVTLDVGDRDNVHPPDKQTVAERLVLAARALVYGEPRLEYSGPLYRTATVDGSAMRIWFTHAQSGLMAGGPPTMPASPALLGFEIAGTDGKFVPATATIAGSTVLVTSPDIGSPKAVRYGWGSWTDANLFNKDGLPASTFTTEDPSVPF
jgi:sialate O-acetylesterase